MSRLGNPLINELLIGIGQKDAWNTGSPAGDKGFAASYSNPLLAQLLPTLYPGVFPNLAKYNSVNGSFATNANGPDRADLVAVLLTGIPASVVPSAPTYSGTGVLADELRLNVAVPATASGQSNLGILGGDIAGFPNGRRVFDDVATIELIAVAGATLGLVDKKFTPDPAATPGKNVSFGPHKLWHRHLGQRHGDLPEFLPVPGYAVVRYVVPPVDPEGVPHQPGSSRFAVVAPVAVHPTIAESLPEPPGPGAVVLDIGGDIGGAVVYAPEALAGSEIEIRRAGASGTAATWPSGSGGSPVARVGRRSSRRCRRAITRRG